MSTYNFTKLDLPMVNNQIEEHTHDRLMASKFNDSQQDKNRIEESIKFWINIKQQIEGLK